MARPQRRDRRAFILDGEGQLHRPKNIRAHVATEMRETDREELAQELSRSMMPWAKLRVLPEGRQ